MESRGIVTELDRPTGQWFAWFADAPEKRFGAKTASQAAGKLFESIPINLRSELKLIPGERVPGHAEFIVAPR